MNYQTTAELIEVIKPYLGHDNITISTENKNWLGREYKSDFVTVDGNVSFEVLDNEIIVFYFTDHTHFEDYTSEPEEGMDDYVKRAKDFLAELFQYRIRHVRNYRGKKLASEKYFIVYDNREDEMIGGTWYGLMRLLNPFAKKSSESETWIYDKEKGCFVTRYPRNPSPDAIAVIDVSEDCYIEIFENANVYSYSIIESIFDEYDGMYYWQPACNVISSGFYDTKEKAIEYAMDIVKHPLF